MLVIQNTIITSDIQTESFQCNLNACKGICCIEGESGAPLEPGETEKIQNIIPLLWNIISPQAKNIINKQGPAYIDRDGDCVTAIVNGKNCIFTCYDDNNCCRCAIEKLFLEGKTNFRKPTSCNLYPLRITQYKDFRAINYHKWNICDPARTLGKTTHTKLYQFLKNPLITKFGKDWYAELEQTIQSANIQ